jgi:hypothetical protein
MWKALKNLFRTVVTYRALSPDVKIRRKVNRWLRDRRPMTLEHWVMGLRETWGVSKAVAVFAYTHLEKYSGLPVSRLRPSDRLDDDLQWTLVCWFDWELCLCEDFCHRFGIDVSEQLDQFAPQTVADVLVFLETQLDSQLGQRRSPDSSIDSHSDDSSQQPA